MTSYENDSYVTRHDNRLEFLLRDQSDFNISTDPPIEPISMTIPYQYFSYIFCAFPLSEPTLFNMINQKNQKKKKWATYKI